MKASAQRPRVAYARAAPAKRFGAQRAQLRQTVRFRAGPSQAVAEDASGLKHDVKAEAAAKAGLQQQPHRGTPSRQFLSPKLSSTLSLLTILINRCMVFYAVKFGLASSFTAEDNQIRSLMSEYA